MRVGERWMVLENRSVSPMPGRRPIRRLGSSCGCLKRLQGHSRSSRSRRRHGSFGRGPPVDRVSAFPSRKCTACSTSFARSLQRRLIISRRRCVSFGVEMWRSVTATRGSRRQLVAQLSAFERLSLSFPASVERASNLLKTSYMP